MMKTLKIKNSLTGKIEEFELKKDEKFKLYLCGPTVYDEVHIGNMRPSLIFDLIIRALKECGIKYNYIQNITDVDDKIINRAKEENKPEKLVADFYTKKYFLNFKKLNLIKPQFQFVTDNMDSIVEFIGKLIKSENAYIMKGNVLFNIQKLQNEYGKLSKQVLDNLSIEQGRQVNKSEKLDRNDFVLWKKTPNGISWKSSWFEGRPGWHTECVTLINKFFKGEVIDIHGGGKDLLFPHHENERIQYIAYKNEELSKAWIHFGHITLKKEKMSKSLGNFVKAEGFIKKYGANTLRILLINAKYNEDIEIDENIITQSLAKAQKIENVSKKINYFINYKKIDIKKYKDTYREEVVDHILNNLETTKVISILDETISFINKNIDNENSNKNKINKKINDFIFICKILGIKINFKNYKEEIFKKIDMWKKALSKKDFTSADKIRKELQKKSIL